MARRGKVQNLPNVGDKVPLRVGPAWLRLTNRMLDAGFESLSDARAAEMFAYVQLSPVKRIKSDMRDIALMEALEGDQGMMSNCLHALVSKLTANEPLSSSEAFGLMVILARIAVSPQGLQVAAGAAKRRGGTRQGAKSMTISLDVLNQLSHGSANSFEEAWAAAAQSLHLSESRVKGAWMDRRELLLQTLRYPVDVSAAQIVTQSVEQGFRKA